MPDYPTKLRTSSRRAGDRVRLSSASLLELSSGGIVSGRTMNISPHSVLVQTDTPVARSLLGTTGTLFIISGGGMVSVGYPCKVARLRGRYVAVQIDKKAATAFGNDIARGQ